MQMFGADGYVDFSLHRLKGPSAGLPREDIWAIEIVRDHDNIDEHVSRFQEGSGKYHCMPMAKWIIIDFCSPGTKLDKLRQNVISFHFDRDSYSSGQLIYSDGREKRLMLRWSFGFEISDSSAKSLGRVTEILSCVKKAKSIALIWSASWRSHLCSNSPATLSLLNEAYWTCGVSKSQH